MDLLLNAIVYDRWVLGLMFLPEHNTVRCPTKGKTVSRSKSSAAWRWVLGAATRGWMRNPLGRGGRAELPMGYRMGFGGTRCPAPSEGSLDEAKAPP